MAQKVCKACRAIFEEAQCPNCQSQEHAENFKGKVIITNPEQSEIAQHLNIKRKGTFAIKIG